MGELTSRIKLYFRFSGLELKGLAIGVVIAGFIFSFRDWGVTDFDVGQGLLNFLVTTLIAAFVFFVHLSAHRIYALSLGFKSEYKASKLGLLISVVLAFATNGVVTTIFPGGSMSSLLTRHRLGEFRYGLNYWENGFVGLIGPIASLGTAIVFKLLNYFWPLFIFEKGLLMSVVFAVCSLFPFPGLDGVNVFFASRTLYITSFSGVVVFAILVLYNSVIVSLLIAVVLALIAGAVYFSGVELKR